MRDQGKRGGGRVSAILLIGHRSGTRFIAAAAVMARLSDHADIDEVLDRLHLA